jgi:hypothetical protein
LAPAKGRRGANQYTKEDPGAKHREAKTGDARDLAKGRKSTLNGKSASGPNGREQKTGDSRANSEPPCWCYSRE